jgi:hypothetical protein
MAVQALGATMDGKGFEKSHAAFVRSHRENTDALLNLAEGKSEEQPRPIYDPSHPDNHWPIMLHHPEKGELTIGTTLKGVADIAERRALLEANGKAKKEALAAGYRTQPYLKPQVVVLDPAVEKAALIAQNQQMQGALVSMQDMVAKLMAEMSSLKKQIED